MSEGDPSAVASGAAGPRRSGVEEALLADLRAALARLGVASPAAQHVERAIRAELAEAWRLPPPQAERATPQLAGGNHVGSLLGAAPAFARGHREAQAGLLSARVPTESVRAARPVAVDTESEPKLDAGKGRRAGLPFFQREVPEEQQPTVELQELRMEPFQSWPEGDDYAKKLFNLYVGINVLASLPVAFVTYHRLPAELPQLLLSANIGTLASMVPFIARLRAGWGFASQRLREKSTYYEANQRGLLAKKDRETSLRDRLVEKEVVAPVLTRIDKSLAAVLAAVVISVGAGEALAVALGENGPATLKAVTGEEAIKFETRLRTDPAFAAREQERARQGMQPDGTGVKPVYCESAYYTTRANAENCD